MMIPKTTKAHLLTALCASAAASIATAQEFTGTNLGNDPSLYGLDPFELALLFEEDAPEPGSLREALQGGKAYTKFRLRHEEVDHDGFDEKGHATTLRTVLGYETAKYDGFTFQLEFDDVHAVAYDAFNDTANGRVERPVVADPQGAGLNQANLKWHGEDGSIVVAGRQKIELNNERFVGDVGWRQNDQTFDALVYHNPAIGPVALTAAYVRGVNTILGGKLNVDTYVLNAGYEVEDIGELAVFNIAMGVDEPAADISTNTLGAFFDGEIAAGDDLDVLFRVEFANQSDFGDSDLDVDTTYTRAEVGVKVSGWTIKAGQEVLGGADDGDASFQTPLATKHGFNGWADVFLTTPGAGLVDNFVEVATTFDDIKVKGIFHSFTADDDVDADDFGSEIDLVASKKLSDHSVAGVKVAAYSAGEDGSGFENDIMKAWIWATYSF